MTELQRNRWLAMLAVVVMGGALSYVAWGNMGQNLVYFWNVDELLAQREPATGATIRLGGVVQKGTVQWDPKAISLRFAMGMQAVGGSSVVVQATSAPPQMFREGIGVVVEGHYDGRVMQAERVLAKHSNEYRPPVQGERPQDIYKTLMESAQAPVE